MKKFEFNFAREYSNYNIIEYHKICIDEEQIHLIFVTFIFYSLFFRLPRTPSSPFHAKSRSYDETSIWRSGSPGTYATFSWRTSNGAEKRAK